MKCAPGGSREMAARNVPLVSREMAVWNAHRTTMGITVVLISGSALFRQYIFEFQRIH